MLVGLFIFCHLQFVNLTVETKKAEREQFYIPNELGTYLRPLKVWEVVETQTYFFEFGERILQHLKYENPLFSVFFLLCTPTLTICSFAWPFTWRQESKTSWSYGEFSARK